MNFVRNESHYPRYLRKHFDELAHAENFMEGNIQISLIESFRSIQGYRRDESENQERSVYKIDDGLINSSHTYVNPVYMLCASGPDADIVKCADKLGQAKVIIGKVAEFRRRIREAWKKFEMAFGDKFYSVQYDKDEEKEPPLYLLPPHGISLWQKPRDYEHENEFRFLLKCKMKAGYCFEKKKVLVLGSIKDIAEIEE